MMTGVPILDIGGTYFVQAREYKAGMGRFTAGGVLRGNHAVPKMLNRYGYCCGNPMGYIDLDGRDPVRQGDFTSISNAPDIYALENEGTNVWGSASISPIPFFKYVNVFDTWECIYHLYADKRREI